LTKGTPLATFAKSVEATIPALRRYARALTRDSDIADDLVQDTLVRALRSEHLFHGGEIRSWLYTILTNLNRNRLRSLARRPMLSPLEDNDAPDLAGPEARYPDPERHRPAIDLARRIGLHVTLHAGEWGGSAQVRRALTLDPERIAHGPLAIDDPELVRELAATGVWLDLCPTSNVQAGIVPTLADHPLARLLRAGVRVTLSTDDLTVADVSLSDEYVRAVEHIGLTVRELWAVDLAALDAAFCDDPTRDRLRAQFLAWGGSIPELAAT